MNLVKIAQEYGVRNLRFFIPMSRLQYAGLLPGIAFRSSDQPTETQECTVDESRYRVADNYKIQLRAVDPVFGSESFYQSDLESIMRDHEEFRLYVIDGDGYTRIPTYQPRKN